MTFPKTFVAAIAAFSASIVVSTPGAFAQTPASASMAGMDMSGSNGSQNHSASTKEFQASDHAMMSGMSGIQYTGDADQDFVAHMIPHHQGAVSMAEVELKYGKDPAMKRLARNIIKAQNEEIAHMKSWQAKHGK